MVRKIWHANSSLQLTVSVKEVGAVSNPESICKAEPRRLEYERSMSAEARDILGERMWLTTCSMPLSEGRPKIHVHSFKVSYEVP
jgi:hypothetical protein